MSAIVPGLCSVTFRASTVDEVVRLAVGARLEAIEWGGDVHVPHGDVGAAKRARDATEAAGLECASYGSYCFADANATPAVVEPVLDVAVELGAANVRVWAPFGAERGSARTGEVVDALGPIVAAAAERELQLSLEFHGGTLTATVDGALGLLGAVGAATLWTYWQPPYWAEGERSAEDDASAVAALAPRLSHLHVYEWTGPEQRRPLAEGEARWRAVLDAVSGAGEWSRARCAFLEFVRDDDPAALMADAAVLRRVLEEVL
jgi:sugar phosphate isomerase/epimerase